MRNRDVIWLAAAALLGAGLVSLGVRGSVASATGALPVLWDAPAFTLTDQNGQAASLEMLAGHVWIADFIFTRCTRVCPLLTAHMRDLQRDLPNPELRFVSFSVDPKGDTVAALREYAKLWAPEETRWSLLHTEDASLRKLLDGMKLIAEDSSASLGPGMHTSLFFLIDGDGRVRGMYDSHDARALERLVNHASRLAP